ncbi:MAG: hypothetical protein HC769_05950 [Cyanobacteria bacterium CRU_2_1]|nr:hypothetical protein [Cyanobacteria bacterium CRU_2_1]
MVLKFLGITKKSKYFLEADPLPPNGAEPNSKKAEPTTPESIKTKSAQPEPASAEVKSTPAQAVVAEPSTSVSKPEAKSKSSKTKSKAAPAPDVETAPMAKSVETTLAPQVSPVFAADNRLTNSTPRRRPGPSLDGFRTMARQVTPQK